MRAITRRTRELRWGLNEDANRRQGTMGEAIAWLVVLALIGLALWSISRANERKRSRSSQEYEREVADARSSMLRAGMLELDKFAGNTNVKRAAVEYLKDEEQGQTRSGGKDDDKDRTEGEELP